MKLTYEQAKDYLHNHTKELINQCFTPAKKTGFICPFCGNGKGPTGTGVIQDPKTGRYKCFKCGKIGDIIDFIGGTDNNAENLKRTCRQAGIEMISDPTQKNKLQDKTVKPVQPATKTQTDYTGFFVEYQKHLCETDYLTERGITPNTAQQWGIGYNALWKHPDSNTGLTSPRIIIPTSPFSYVARYTGTNPAIPRYIKVGESNILGIDRLKDYKEPVFIVEGELDAITLSQLGRASVGLGSTTNYKKLIDYIGRNGLKNDFIIALDNDNAGEDTAKALKEALDAIGLKNIIYSPYGAYKDANEAFTKIGEQDFQKELNKALETFKDKTDTERQDYLRTSTRYYIDDFFTRTDSLIDTPFIPTGFRELDKALDGGLYEGLHIIGAISSLGKTTFVLQIADQIARTGQDVLIFSLEQSKFELVAKSISRLTAEQAILNNDIRLAKSLRDITTRQRINQLNEQEIENLMKARQIYKDEISQNVYILEGMGEITALDIRASVEKHIRITGNKPIVIVDYLQILAPIDTKHSYTDKQNTDLSITELKRLTRDNKLSLIAISSFNRDNYTTGANMGAFKESGSIEYSSDILIGLQLKGIDDMKKDKTQANSFIDNAKNKDIREIELKILKNRNGPTGATLNFTYRPRFNYFKET